MQIKIDIDEELYNYMQTEEYDEHLDKRFDFQIRFAVANGIPLPNGHGRLKDIDKIINDGRSKGFCDWYDEMKYAPTIIEADKEREE